MPVPTGHAGRGSSFWEPTEQAKNVRLFQFKRSAQAALTQWLRGRQEAVFGWEMDDFSGSSFQYQVGTEATHDPSRVRKDMEIVLFELVEKSS